MLIVEERALITDLQDKIIARLVEKQEAWVSGNAALATRLQDDIDRLRVECAYVRHAAGEHDGAPAAKRAARPPNGSA